MNQDYAFWQIQIKVLHGKCPHPGCSPSTFGDCIHTMAVSQIKLNIVNLIAA